MASDPDLDPGHSGQIQASFLVSASPPGSAKDIADRSFFRSLPRSVGSVSPLAARLLTQFAARPSRSFRLPQGVTLQRFRTSN